MTKLTVTSVAIAMCSLGCGGAQQPVEPPVSASQPAASTPAPEPDPAVARLRAQQGGTCEPMCERLADCAVEDLAANESPDQVARMELDKLVPRLRDECEQDCRRRELSPRQVQVMRDCLGMPLVCPEFLDCLDQASPRDGS